MKKLTMILLTLAIAACNPAKESDSAASAVSTVYLKVRQEFTQACIQSAVGQDTNNDAKRDYAKLICGCVYDEGVTQYGSEQKWVEEVIAFGNNATTKEKLDKFSDEAINRCVSKNPPNNSATASAF